jgi:hypothetical protein
MLNKTSTGSNAQQNNYVMKCSTKQAPDEADSHVETGHINRELIGRRLRWFRLLLLSCLVGN